MCNWNRIINKDAIYFKYSVINLITVTSRAPKPKEEEGREYYFRTKAEILNKIRAGEMVEWGELDNQLYGTRSFIYSVYF